MNWGWDEPAPPLFSSNIYRRTLFVSTGSVLRGEESISRSNISNVSILEAMPLTTTFLWTRQAKRRGGVSVICPSSYILQTIAFVFTNITGIISSPPSWDPFIEIFCLTQTGGWCGLYPYSILGTSYLRLIFPKSNIENSAKLCDRSKVCS